MNRIPRTLRVIESDLRRYQSASRRTNFSRLTPTGARQLLQRFYSIRRRLVSCRFVFSSPARVLRARILRQAFQAWRAAVRKALGTITLQNWITDHLRETGAQLPILDPNNWVIKLLCLEPLTFRQIVPALVAGVPVTAQQDPRDPWWLAAKLNLSSCRL